MATKYDPNSIVDTLTQAGKPSDYSSRAALAKSLGIEGYAGTGSQNTDLIRRYTASLTPPADTTTPVVPPTVTNPNPNPNPTPTPTPTPAVTRYSNPYDTAAESYYNNLSRTFTPENEAAIREQRRQAAQAQIDAVNLIFNQKKSVEEVAGNARLDRSRAIGSNSGLIGSARGETQRQNVVTGNKQAQDVIDAERNLQIQTIYGNIDQRATEEIAARKKEVQGNNEQYLNFLKSSVDTAKEDIKNLAGLGVTQTQMDKRDIEDLLKQTGYNQLELDAIWNANLPDSMKTKWIDTTAPDAEGKAVVTRVGYNPQTGKTEKKTYTLDVPYDQIATKELKEIDGVLYSVDAKTGTAKALTAPSESKMLDIQNKKLQNAKLYKELTTENTGIPEKVLTKIQASPEYKTINGILPAIQAIKNYKDSVEKYGTYEAWSGAGKGEKQATYGNAIAAWKTLAGLGALSGADFGLAENVIPEGGKLFARNSKQEAQLNKALENATTQAEFLTKRLSQTYPSATELLNQQLQDIKTTSGQGNTNTVSDDELLSQYGL